MSSRVCCKLEVIVQVGNVWVSFKYIQNAKSHVSFLKASSVKLSTIHAFIFTVKQKGVTGYLLNLVPRTPLFVGFWFVFSKSQGVEEW